MRLVPRQRLALRVNLTVVIVTLVVCAADAATKIWVRHSLHQPIHVAGLVWLRLQYNSGISFSINNAGPVVTTVATIAVATIVVAVGLNAARGAPAVGFGLLIGGGVANVLDRLAANPHQVTDFVALGSFPVFNLADVAITAGFITLVVAALSGERLLGR